MRKKAPLRSGAFPSYRPFWFVEPFIFSLVDEPVDLPVPEELFELT
jgi:hypothetical protein